MKGLSRLLLFLILVSEACNLGPEREKGQNIVLNIGGDRQLFVDDYIVEKLTEGAQYQLHHPQIKEVVLECNEPWEGSYSNYNSIFKDGNIYRMYYRGWHRGMDGVPPKGQIGHDMVWCYAESRDGIHG